MFAGVSLDCVSADQLTIPFLVMMLIIAFTTWSTSKANLPDIEGTREETQNVESEGRQLLLMIPEMRRNAASGRFVI